MKKTTKKRVQKQAPSKVITKRGQYIDPNSDLYAKLSFETRQAEYQKMYRVVNQRLKQLKKDRNEKQSDIYQYMERNDIRLKTGAIGVSQVGFSTWNESKLKQETELLHNILNAPSTLKVKEDFHKKMAKNLSYSGVDYDQLKDNPDYADELEIFYAIYGKARKMKIFEELNMDKYEAYEAIIEFLQSKPNAIRSKQSAAVVAGKMASKLEKINEMKSIDMKYSTDDYRMTYLRDNYDEKKMKSISDALLYRLAKKTYAGKESALTKAGINRPFEKKGRKLL